MLLPRLSRTAPEVHPLPVDGTAPQFFRIAFSCGKVAVLLAVLMPLILIGCAGKKAGRHEVTAITGLTIHPPASDDDWRSIRTDYSQFYVATRDQLYDEDLIALFIEIVPLMRSIDNEDQLLAYIRQSLGPSTTDVGMDSLMGRPVLRFDTVARRVENPARFRQLFRLKPRLADAIYTKRSKGILFCHPENKTQAIRIGIWRNSYHGQIGEYFESIASDFAASFLVANGLVKELR